MMKLANTIATLILCCFAAACSFNEGGVPDDDPRPAAQNPSGVFEPATPIACESHSDCDDGSNCTVNRCMDGVCKVYDNDELDCECVIDSDCDDGLSCTTDTCSADGVCSNESDCEGSDTCHAEYDVCAPDGAECITPAHCDDSDTSTDDYCTDNVCENLPNGTVCGNGTCEVGEDSTSCPSDCSEPECTVNSDCDDGDTSTDDYCTDEVCENLPNGSVCGDGTCDASEDSTSCPADCTTSSVHNIDCDVSGSTLTITITGYITQALVGTTSSDGDYLKIGGDPHGWGDYTVDTTERPLTPWAGDTNGDGTAKTYVVTVPSTWTHFNFWLSQVGGGAHWFDLDEYAVTGDCSFTVGDGQVTVD